MLKATMLAFARVPTRVSLMEEYMSFIFRKYMSTVTSTVYCSPMFFLLGKVEKTRGFSLIQHYEVTAIAML